MRDWEVQTPKHPYTAHPASTDAHLTQPLLTPLTPVAADWPGPLVDFSWDAPFRWGPGPKQEWREEDMV